MEKKILLGMSGGIDSTYSVLALRRMGYSVEGAILKMSENTDVEGAHEAANALSVPLHVVDCEARFRDVVIADFISEYSVARTPNPCVICNREVKFASLFDLAERRGISHISTGHYAKVKRDDATGRYYISRADDLSKDQSYVLWRLTQEQLSRLVLPLGSKSKREVKEESRALLLPATDAPESQEICFIPTKDYVSYIEAAKGVFPKGAFIDETGKVVGEHRGIIHYTIGQRKGLGLSLGAPVFVCAIDPLANTVTVSDESHVFSSSLVCDSLNFMKLDPGNYEQLRASVKIRYSARPEMATIRIEGDRAWVQFDHPVRAVTPGQSVVFYENDDVLFGGIIGDSKQESNI